MHPFISVFATSLSRQPRHAYHWRPVDPHLLEHAGAAVRRRHGCWHLQASGRFSRQWMFQTLEFFKPSRRRCNRRLLAAADFQNCRSTGSKKRILAPVPRYYPLELVSPTRRSSYVLFDQIQPIQKHVIKIIRRVRIWFHEIVVAGKVKLTYCWKQICTAPHKD